MKAYADGEIGMQVWSNTRQAGTYRQRRCAGGASILPVMFHQRQRQISTAQSTLPGWGDLLIFPKLLLSTFDVKL